MIKVKHLTKRFQSRIIFDDLSFTFPSTGFIAIVGESGCGKSTLLNILANLDNDYSGDVIFNNYKYRDYQKDISKEIGIIYQNYNLLDSYTAFENIKISALINDNFAAENIYDLANQFGIDHGLLGKKCAVLSGGEKQRIAILRVLINRPSIILADEPTGALDSKNSEIVMEILKEISKTSLVIMVTHNLILAEKYCDNVISFSNLNKTNLAINAERKKKFKNQVRDNSFFQLIKCHMSQNKMRHVLAILSLVFTFVFTNLCLTFVFESRNIANSVSSNFYDRSVFTVSKSEKEKIEDSMFSYVQLTRPTPSEMIALKNVLPDFDFYYDLSIFYPNVISINSNDKVIDNVLFLPCFENLTNNEIIINTALSNLIESNLITTKLESQFLYQNETFQFETEFSLKIIEVIEEINILNNPKIYYNYFLAYDYLSKKYLSKSSQKTYLQVIKEANNNDALSSYQMLINVKDKTKISEMYKIMNKGITNYEITSNAYSIENTINEIVKAFLLVLLMFEVITIVSCFSIILYITLSIIIDYQKEKAILISMGKDKNSFFKIFLAEMIILFLISIIIGSIILLIIKHYLKLMVTTMAVPLNINILIPFLLSAVIYFSIIFIITFIANERLKKENLIDLLRNE